MRGGGHSRFFLQQKHFSHHDLFDAPLLPSRCSSPARTSSWDLCYSFASFGIPWSRDIALLPTFDSSLPSPRLLDSEYELPRLTSRSTRESNRSAYSFLLSELSENRRLFLLRLVVLSWWYPLWSKSGSLSSTRDGSISGGVAGACSVSGGMSTTQSPVSLSFSNSVCSVVTRSSSDSLFFSSSWSSSLCWASIAVWFSLCSISSLSLISLSLISLSLISLSLISLSCSSLSFCSISSSSCRLQYSLCSSTFFLNSFLLNLNPIIWKSPNDSSFSHFKHFGLSLFSTVTLSYLSRTAHSSTTSPRSLDRTLSSNTLASRVLDGCVCNSVWVLFLRITEISASEALSSSKSVISNPEFVPSDWSSSLWTLPPPTSLPCCDSLDPPQSPSCPTLWCHTADCSVQEWSTDAHSSDGNQVRLPTRI